MGFYLHVFGGSTYFLFDSSAEPGPSVSCPWWSFRHQPVKMAKKHPRWSWPSSQPSFLCWCQCCIWDSTKPWGVKPPILVGWRPGQNNLKKIWRPMFDGSQIINYCRSIFGHITVEASLDILGGLLQAVHKQASLKGSYTTIHEMIESPFDAFSLWHVQDHIISQKKSSWQCRFLAHDLPTSHSDGIWDHRSRQTMTCFK